MIEAILLAVALDLALDEDKVIRCSFPATAGEAAMILRVTPTGGLAGAPGLYPVELGLDKEILPGAVQAIVTTPDADVVVRSISGPRAVSMGLHESGAAVLVGTDPQPRTGQCQNHEKVFRQWLTF